MIFLSLSLSVNPLEVLLDSPRTDTILSSQFRRVKLRLKVANYTERASGALARQVPNFKCSYEFLQVFALIGKQTFNDVSINEFPLPRNVLANANE